MPHASGVEAVLGSNFLPEESECLLVTFVHYCLLRFFGHQCSDIEFPNFSAEREALLQHHYLQQWRTDTTLLALVPSNTFLLSRIN
jgi:hypothetical protein